jgi:hypothetical protein
MWDLWWTKWHWAKYSQCFVTPCQFSFYHRLSAHVSPGQAISCPTYQVDSVQPHHTITNMFFLFVLLSPPPPGWISRYHSKNAVSSSWLECFRRFAVLAHTSHGFFQSPQNVAIKSLLGMKLWRLNLRLLTMLPIFRVVASYRPVVISRFDRTYCLHLHCCRENRTSGLHEAGNELFFFFAGHLLGLLLNPEDEGSMFLIEFLPDYRMVYPKIHYCSWSMTADGRTNCRLGKEIRTKSRRLIVHSFEMCLKENIITRLWGSWKPEASGLLPFRLTKAFEYISDLYRCMPECRAPNCT